MLKLIQNIGSIGLVASLTSKEIVQRQFLVYMGLLMSIGGIVWGSICLVYNLYFPAIIPLGYVLITILNFSLFYFSKKFNLVRFIQVGISLALPLIFQISLGGFVSSGMVALWALLSLVASITFQNIKSALYWAGAYILSIIALGFFDNYLDHDILPKEASIFLFVINTTFISAIIVLLILYFVTSRDNALEQIEKTQRQTETMLDSITQGLLLIDKNYLLKDQYSKITESIVDTNHISKAHFSDFLIRLNSEIKKDSINSFLKLLFSKKLSRKKLKLINPLVDFKATLKSGEKKQLEFEFFQVIDQKNVIEEIFVVIDDKTEEFKSKAELIKQQHKSDQRIETISMILNAQPEMVESFTSEAQAEINNIKDFLRNSNRDTKHADAIAHIYRGVHAIKGNASLLNLKELAEGAHLIEEKIELLKKQDAYDGSAYLDLLADIINLEEIFKDIISILGQLQNFSKPKENQSIENALRDSLQHLVRDISQKLEKPVQLTFVNNLPLNEISLNTLRTLLIQLTRNAIVHGIESQQLRQEKDKPKIASIEIETTTTEEITKIRISDDGRGLDIEKIRTKSKLPLTATDKQIIQSVFRKGISTAEKIDIHAGRGMGLDIVKVAVEKLGGRIIIKTNEALGTVFTIEVPSKSE